jgi:RpiB/LacA/LacB family sugar-phosphate isomerase
VRIVVGSDHAGLTLKCLIRAYLLGHGHYVHDVGTHTGQPVDYPDFAENVAALILDGRAERGVLICGSGVGASVAANKIPGIRAGLCHDTYSAHQGVEHDEMNVLVLGGRVIGEEVARELVEAFAVAVFSGEARHARRLAKVSAIEKKYGATFRQQGS